MVGWAGSREVGTRPEAVPWEAGDGTCYMGKFTHLPPFLDHICVMGSKVQIPKDPGVSFTMMVLTVFKQFY